MANGIFFSPTMKMAQLVQLNYRLLYLLPRFGIRLGFGERSVEEVCRQYGVQTALFLLVCDIYTDDDMVPPTVETADLGGLVRYLHNSHLYYIEERIPAFDSRFEQVVGGLDGQRRQVLVQFYENYRRELLAHFDYEERQLFPYVISVAEGRRQQGYSIEEFEKNHSDIEEKLDDLKNIIIKYLPEKGDSISVSPAADMLVELFRLGDDLARHTYIEDRILVPLVSELEKR